jgi:subtilisin family serine protease
VVVSGFLLAAFPANVAGASGQDGEQEERVIVTFASGTQAAAQDASGDRAGDVRRRVDDRRVAVEVTDAGRRALERNPRVTEVAPDHRIQATRVPNDPCYSGSAGCSGRSQWSLPQIGAPVAWNYTTGAPNITVAVLDTGVDGTHPDLADSLKASKDFVDDGINTSADDNGHGTWVAGVIAATGNNALGTTGVAWNARLVSYKVLDAGGSGWDSDLAAAIRAAANDGAAVINVSAAGKWTNSAVEAAVAYAAGKNVTIVAAAGNDGTSSPAYPAAYEPVVAVGATNRDGSRAPFSSFGSWVDLAAPGVGILTTAKGGDYGQPSGTSFSSPAVAGVAVLLRSAGLTTASSVRNRLLATATQNPPGLGAGLVQAGAALSGVSAVDWHWTELGANGGLLGAQAAPEYPLAVGFGRFRHFQGGSIYWSPLTGAQEAHGAIRGLWAQLGWERSALGYPATDELQTTDGVGRFNLFQGGSIYWSPSTNAHEVHGAIGVKWSQIGSERSPVGYPVTDQFSTPDGVGRYNHFQAGSVYWSPYTNAQEIHGAIRALWAHMGWERSVLGYPVTDELPGSDGVGRYNHFQGGSIYWSPSTGVHEVHGAIQAKWSQIGFERSPLRYPVTDELPTPDGVGRYNHFQGGSIYWSPSTNAHDVYGPIRDRWAQMGWERSSLGYPVTDVYPTARGQRAEFQRGVIEWDPGMNATTVTLR